MNVLDKDATLVSDTGPSALFQQTNSSTIYSVDVPCTARKTTKAPHETAGPLPQPDTSYPSALDPSASVFAQQLPQWTSSTMHIDTKGIVGAATQGSHTQLLHALLHPQGFRILKDSSIIERNMLSYFRLPRPPNDAWRVERHRLEQQFKRLQESGIVSRRCVLGAEGGVVLDGFLLLSAAGAEDPMEVEQVTLHDSQLNGSVPEDLAYFTQLKSLDVTENQLRLLDVLPLPRLETLHFTCNQVFSLAELADVEKGGSRQGQYTGGSVLPSSSPLRVLNLAYNRIPASHLKYLSCFHALCQLDLCGNALRRLPPDLSCLTHVTHLSLESNELSAAATFHSLSTMPSLREVNLNRNALYEVPPLASQPGSSAAADAFCFPALSIISLSENLFRRTEQLLPLAVLHRTLRCIIADRNPIWRDARNEVRTRAAFDEAILKTYYTEIEKDMPTMGQSGVGPWHLQSWTRLLPRRFADKDATRSSAVMAEAEVEETPSLQKTPPNALDGIANTYFPADEEFIRYDKVHGFGGLTAGTAPQGPSHGSPASSPPGVALSADSYLQTNRILLVSAEEELVKRPTRYFYSLEYRQAHPSVEGVTPLVSIPVYEDFMDIRRLAKSSARTAKQKPAKKCSVARESESHQDSAPTSTSTRLPDASVLPTLSTGTAPTETPPPLESLTGNNRKAADVPGIDYDGFFLTEVAGGAMAAREMEAGQGATKTNAEPHRGAKKGQREPTPAAMPPLPISVISPATANVHLAMEELRAMLRKPLPPLPYTQPRRRK